MEMDILRGSNMNQYYIYRKIIQQLYVNDTLYGDLAGSLLGIRERLSSIDSMSLKIQELTINIELAHDTEKHFDNINEVMSMITSTINTYIINNINFVTDEQTANNIIDYIHKGINFFDATNVGYNITIGL